MGRERQYHQPPETVFQACINAIAYLDWTIRDRDGSRLRIEATSPFTTKKLSPTFQDRIDIEVIPDDGVSHVWVHSEPRFQLWNWGQDRRNEKNFLEEVTREVERGV